MVRTVGVVQTLWEPVNNNTGVDLVDFDKRVRSVPPIQRNVNLLRARAETTVHHPQVLLRGVISPAVPASRVLGRPDILHLYTPHEAAPRPRHPYQEQDG